MRISVRHHVRAIFWVLVIANTACLYPAASRAQIDTEFRPVFYDPATPDTLLLDGVITNRTPLMLKRAMSKHSGITKLHLQSPGGFVNAALSMAYSIHDAGLNTHIPGDGTCESSCAFMLFAGIQRTVDGRLGVHRLRSPSNKLDVGQIALSDIVTALNDFGFASGEILARLLKTPPDSMYYFTQAELSELGIVTNSESGQTPGNADDEQTAIAEDVAEETPSAVAETPPAAAIPPSEKQRLLTACTSLFRPLDQPAFRFNGSTESRKIWESFSDAPRQKQLEVCSVALIADPTNPEAQFYFGLASLVPLENRDENSEAIYWMKLAARSGYAPAAGILSWARGFGGLSYQVLHLFRDGDCAQDTQWLITAAQNGDLPSLYEMARSSGFEDVCGIPELVDTTQAKLERVAELGFAPAAHWASHYHLRWFSDDITKAHDAVYAWNADPDKGEPEIGYFWLDSAVAANYAPAALESAIRRLRGHRTRFDGTRQLGAEAYVELPDAERRARYARGAETAADEVLLAVSMGFPMAVRFVENLSLTTFVSQGDALDASDWKPACITRDMNDTQCSPYKDSFAAVKLDAFAKRLQTLLKEAGHYSGPIDGDFGPGSKTALQRMFAETDRTVDPIRAMEVVKAFPTDVAADPAALFCLSQGHDAIQPGSSHIASPGYDDPVAAYSLCNYAQSRFPQDAELIHNWARLQQVFGHQFDIQPMLDDAGTTYARAAALDYPPSQYRLALFSDVIGVEQIAPDKMTSVQRLNLRKAANAGFAPARETLQQIGNR